MDLVQGILLMCLFSSSIAFAQDDTVLHEPKGQMLNTGEIEYTVEWVIWLENDNQRDLKKEVKVKLVIDSSGDTLRTSIPILNGKNSTEYLIDKNTTHDFTGASAIRYGSRVVDLTLTDIVDKSVHLHVMISDRLIIHSVWRY